MGLVSKTFTDLRFFTLFFIFWIVTFAFLYQILGIDVPKDDYAHLSVLARYQIQVFRNSIGDLEVPEFSVWESLLDTNPGLAYLMISLGWATWLFNLILTLICLLNFLIAIVSTSYEETVSSAVQNRAI